MSITSHHAFITWPSRRVALAPSGRIPRAISTFLRDPTGTLPRFIVMAAIMIGLPTLAEQLPLIINHIHAVRP